MAGRGAWGLLLLGHNLWRPSLSLFTRDYIPFLDGLFYQLFQHCFPVSFLDLRRAVFGQKIPRKLFLVDALFVRGDDLHSFVCRATVFLRGGPLDVLFGDSFHWCRFVVEISRRNKYP